MRSATCAGALGHVQGLPPWHRARKGDVEAHRQDAHRHHQNDDRHVDDDLSLRVQQAIGSSAGADNGEDAADERWEGIPVAVAHHRRHFIEQHVPDQSAGEGGEHAQEDGGHAAGAIHESLLRAVDGEQAQRKRIKDDHRPVHAVHFRMHDRHDQPGGKGGDHHAFVGYPHGRPRPQDDIADKTAAQRGHPRRQKDGEEVIMLAHGGKTSKQTATEHRQVLNAIEKRIAFQCHLCRCHRNLRVIALTRAWYGTGRRPWRSFAADCRRRGAQDEGYRMPAADFSTPGT